MDWGQYIFEILDRFLGFIYFFAISDLTNFLGFKKTTTKYIIHVHVWKNMPN